MGAASAHAPLPPSSAHRWMRCAFSVHGTPVSSTDTEHSRLGTFAHAVAAHALAAGRDLKEYIGLRLDPVRFPGAGEFAVDADMADHLRVYMHEVIANQLVLGASMCIEEKVVLVPGEVYGTADALLATDDTLLVIDLKYGAGILVEVEDNEQLLTYAAAALRGSPGVKSVGMMIVQPRRPDSAGNVVRFVERSADEIRAFAARVERRVAEIRGGARDAVPGDHCGFCPKAATCPALADQANAIAAQVFRAEGPPEPAALAPDAIVKLLDGIKRFESWVDAVRKHAESEVLAGRLKLPGYKLVETLGNRRWTDPADAEARLRKAGIDPVTTSTISPAEAERRLGRSRKQLLPETTRDTSGVRLVPETDKRPAVADATRVFLDNPLNPDD